MQCNARTMIKVAAVLGGILAVAYTALPQAREFVVASAPILLILVCPISMLAMMFTMRGKESGTGAACAREPQSPSPSPAAEAPAQGQATANAGPVRT